MPVLADCSAHLVGEQARWRHGPALGPSEAPPFYDATVLAIVVGAVIALLDLPPIQLVYWASIAGGLATPIGLVLLLLVAGDRRAMGQGRVGKSLLAVGWTAAAVITVVSAVFLSQQIGSLLPLPT